MATKPRLSTPKATNAARMRQPMSRADVHALMKGQATIFLGAMNELEGRIQELEAKVTGERKTASGLVLPASMNGELPQ